MEPSREGRSKPAEASTEKANPGGDPKESQPVTSTVSEDEHLDGNRGDEPWNHEKHGDDKTPQWTGGAIVPITTMQCIQILSVLTMILCPAIIVTHRNQPTRLAVTPIVNEGQHQNSLESLFGSNTTLSQETWENKPSPPNHQHVSIQGVGPRIDKGETSPDQGSGGLNQAPNKGTLPGTTQMDAYDAEVSHEYENAPKFEKGLREPVGTHRTKAGLGAGQKQGPVGAHTTAGEVLKSVGIHQTEKMTVKM